MKRFFNLAKLVSYSVVYYFAAVGVKCSTSGGAETVGMVVSNLFYGLAALHLLIGVLSTTFASDKLIEEVNK